jgi:dTDP-L-rhamnose 4-epimerase
LRDFVSVKDVSRAFRLALEHDNIGGEVFNIGSGRKYSISEVALKLAAVLNKSHIKPVKNMVNIGPVMSDTVLLI